MTKRAAGVSVLLATVPSGLKGDGFASLCSKSSDSQERKKPTEEEFLDCFRQNVADVIANAYKAEPELHHSLGGEITTSLCEDVFSLVSLQLEALQEYLNVSELSKTPKGTDMLLEGLRAIVDSLIKEQKTHRDKLLEDIESCCAAANDFIRMLEKTEEFLSDLQEEYAELAWNSSFDDDRDDEVPPVGLFHREISNLMTAYGHDAVYAVQYAHVFVLRTIKHSDIPKNLFSRDWEDVYTHNEVALSLIKTMEDFLYDFHNFLVDEMLYRKVVAVLIQAIVCFYVRCFIRKAERLRQKRPLSKLIKSKEQKFESGERALCRMMYDIDLFRNYFGQLVKQIPPLGKVVQDELSTLVVITECFALAITDPVTSQIEDLALVLHKRTGANANITRFLIMDIWMLGAPRERQPALDKKLRGMHDELMLMSLRMQWVPQRHKTKPALKGILLDETLKDVYDERLLQEQIPCGGSLVHNIKHQVKHQVVDRIRKPRPKRRTSSPPVPLEQVISYPRPLPNFSPYPNVDHDKFLENFHESFVEVLKLHNLKIFVTSSDELEPETRREVVNPLKEHRKASRSDHNRT
uniref:Exocyst complex component Sec6 n=1 Tax=Grammatophora oceanica TaxID=210454 RepID=A0A7S1UUI6_9STRA|mmetsp:Transcript_19910/g.29471  ORF Transcript_19910/g.29471 Transcript_19910/m.29471 type:complete len:579 (+) Transcript_19910:116-1852(+)|eukprot:CAMPEP_0194041110 /NCGR_PEP_ID=MMETSP0009_2-20130614/13013_1 /TAXON_ID=210454 /ORGANISM="Grammatophora oceanica, Strain CCMP 410" /LENGTH=578 /DNA_ID=CAMNT_0038684475 /DNA_START=84 /DNA_END=1820 /DNA_ORIENTATION=+